MRMTQLQFELFDACLGILQLKRQLVSDIERLLRLSCRILCGFPDEI